MTKRKEKSIGVLLHVKALGKWGQTGMPAIIIRRPLCGSVGLEETEDWLTQITLSVCQELQEYREKSQTFKDTQSQTNPWRRRCDYLDKDHKGRWLLHLLLNKDLFFLN